MVAAHTMSKSRDSRSEQTLYIHSVKFYNDTLQRLECVQTCARVHSRRDAERYCRMNIVMYNDNLHMGERLRLAMNRDN